MKNRIMLVMLIFAFSLNLLLNHVSVIAASKEVQSGETYQGYLFLFGQDHAPAGQVVVRWEKSKQGLLLRKSYWDHPVVKGKAVHLHSLSGDTARVSVLYLWQVYLYSGVITLLSLALIVIIRRSGVWLRYRLL